MEWAGFHKRSGFGNLIILTYVYGFKTYYGHLKRVVVKSGQFVKKGDLIGYTGNSGLSNGSHLHYNEIFEKEKKGTMAIFNNSDMTNKGGSTDANTTIMTAGAKITREVELSCNLYIDGELEGSMEADRVKIKAAGHVKPSLES